MKGKKGKQESIDALGLKSVLLWCKLIQCACQSTRVGEQDKAVLEAHKTEITDPAMLNDFVLVCKFKKEL